jgi:ubiquinone/menaquinone biosynthesis C-methylase UbiE
VGSDPGADGPGYALALSAGERTRYRLHAQRALELEGERWRRYGVAPGARIADVGCGPGAVLVELARIAGDTGAVVGVEPAAEAREAAREEIATAGVRNATVIDGRADRTGLEQASQDVVMVRLVLYHLGRSGAQAAVRHLATLLRPGGHLYVVDVDSTAVRFSVDDPDVAEAGERYRSFQRSRGCDISIGPRLGSLLAGAGLELVERGAWFHVVPGELLTLGGPQLAAQQEMLAAGAATAEDAARWEAGRTRFAATPDAAIFVPQFLAVGRRPA